MNNTATIHTRAWAGDEALTLTFPEGWIVETFGPEECPQVTSEQIQTAFDKPHRHTANIRTRQREKQRCNHRR